MWSDLQNEVADRILETRLFFRGRRKGRIAEHAHRTVAKGLVFVQLYAIYEYTVKSIVKEAINDLKVKPTPISALRLELLSLALHPEVSSVIDSNRNKQWDSRVALFNKVNSVVPFDIDDTVFPDDGSHFRAAQLRTVWKLFGITQPIVPGNRFLGRIEELVEHRNAIAHGRDTASNIGRRFSVPDIDDRIDDTSELCMYLIKAVCVHCANPGNLAR